MGQKSSSTGVGEREAVKAEALDAARWGVIGAEAAGKRAADLAARLRAQGLRSSAKAFAVGQRPYLARALSAGPARFGGGL